MTYTTYISDRTDLIYLTHLTYITIVADIGHKTLVSCIFI